MFKSKRHEARIYLFLVSNIWFHPTQMFYFLFFIFLGDFFSFSLQYSALLHLPPLRFIVPTDAGIEPRTVATCALAVRRSNSNVQCMYQNWTCAMCMIEWKFFSWDFKDQSRKERFLILFVLYERVIVYWCTFEHWSRRVGYTTD